MALPSVYFAPTDGSVAVGTAWVTDVCANCGRVHCLTPAGLQRSQLVGADLNPSPPWQPYPNNAPPAQTSTWYTCNAPAATPRNAIFCQVAIGTPPAAVVAAIAAANTWNS